MISPGEELLAFAACVLSSFNEQPITPGCPVTFRAALAENIVDIFIVGPQGKLRTSRHVPTRLVACNFIQFMKAT
jgi:hypothetical protein